MSLVEWNTMYVQSALENGAVHVWFHCLLRLLMLYWVLLENVIHAVREQKVGTAIVLQALQETLQKVYANLSNTWTKPQYVRQKRSDKIRDIDDD